MSIAVEKKDTGEEYVPRPYVSFSRLDSLGMCSLNHFFKYTLGIKISTSPNLFFGTAFHNALEYFHQNICKTATGIELPDLASTAEVFSESWAEELMNNKVDFSDPKKPNADGYHALGINLLTTYIKKGIEKGNSLFVPPIGTELHFQIPILNLDTGEIITDDYELVGKIDLVAETNEFGLIVVDHKTAAQKYQDHKVKLGMQLTMYAYAIRYLIAQGVIETTKTQEDNVGYNVFLKYKVPDIKLYYTPRVQNDMDRMYKFFHNAFGLLDSGLYFPQEGIHCGIFCDYREQCQLYGTPWFEKFTADKIYEKENRQSADNRKD